MKRKSPTIEVKTGTKVTTNSIRKNRPSSPSVSDGQAKDATQHNFYQTVADILHAARTNAYRAVNFAMVEAYWQVGRTIVEEEQRGEARAGYGAQLIRQLSQRLGADLGAGFSVQSLWNMRQFYQCFQILSALRRELSWSHYKVLIRVENTAARAYYLTEAADQNWSTRALERQIYSLYYERLLMSRDKSSVVEEMQQNIAPLAPTPEDFIKDPYVLEFLGIPDAHAFREANSNKPSSTSSRHSCSNSAKVSPLSPASSASQQKPKISSSIWCSTITYSNVSSWLI